MTRRRAELETDAGAPAPGPSDRSGSRFEPGPRAAIINRTSSARTIEEAEERYVIARDAWLRAMHAANSGRPADLASLAIAQQAYETAIEERERWISGVTVAVPVESSDHRNLEAAISNELAWRGVLDSPKPVGFFGRLRRRFRKSEE